MSMVNVLSQCCTCLSTVMHIFTTGLAHLGTHTAALCMCKQGKQVCPAAIQAMIAAMIVGQPQAHQVAQPI